MSGTTIKVDEQDELPTEKRKGKQLDTGANKQGRADNHIGNAQEAVVTVLMTLYSLE